MVHGKAFEREQVVKPDSERFDVVFSQLAENVRANWSRKFKLSELYFDEDFPNTRQTQREIAGPGKNLASVL